MIAYEIVVTFFVVTLFITESRLQSSLASKQLNKTIESDLSGQESYRLPDFIKPENYRIVLTPHFNDEFGKKFTFDGFVEITLVIEKEVPAVIVHSKNLEFSRDHVVLPRNDENQTIDTTIQYDPISHFNYIRPMNFANLTSGKYILSIKYKGILNEIPKGFHRSPYWNKNGEEIWVAKTFFEPIFARRAFPCLDEPALKATFDLTIRHPFNYSAISNMPIKISISIGSLQETTFETTPMMSTYLLATVISDFKNIHRNKNFTVYARPDHVNDGKLALEVSHTCCQKMDQVADLGQSKSMENWGLILYMEDILLGDDGEKEAIKLVAHEFAHQWFGNPVTPKWWKFIWLREGFAHFFCNYVTDQIYPQYRSTDWSMIRDNQEAFFVDSLYMNTHPLNRDIERPAEIENLFEFDAVPYKKGSAIIRMMYHFLGQVIFKRGVNIYLIKNKYKSVDSSDLFQAFDEAIKEHKFDLGSNLENVMNSWVNCKGYPVVTVIRDYNNPGLLTIKQDRYQSFSNYVGESSQENNCSWHIPISYATARNPQFNDTSFDFWLQEPSKNVSIKIESDEWLIINKQQTGFYRVNYDKKNWQLIINHLNSEKFDEIHVLNRVQILIDVADFTIYNHLEIEISIGLISYLSRERDYIAFNAGSRLVSWLLITQRYTNHSLVVQEKVLNIVRTILKPTDSDGLNADSKPINEGIRNHAIRWACSLKDTTCPVESKKNDLLAISK